MVPCSNTPDSNEWIIIRLQWSFMMSSLFECGVLVKGNNCRRASQVYRRFAVNHVWLEPQEDTFGSDLISGLCVLDWRCFQADILTYQSRNSTAVINNVNINYQRRWVRFPTNLKCIKVIKVFCDDLCVVTSWLYDVTDSRLPPGGAWRLCVV